MSKFNRAFFFILLLFLSQKAIGQYSISGYLDTPDKGKRVYLSLLEFNNLYGINEKQILSSTLTDSLGYFSFEGNLLSEKHALYRIYANINEGIEGIEKYDTEDLKNFHNFIFSNNDTIVFEKNKKYWFSSETNTNPIDNQLKEYNQYALKLRNEFADFQNNEMVSQYASQMLVELKSYIFQKKAHPLISLILIGTLPPSAIKQDLKEDPKFYSQLQENLNSYFENSFYAIQFEDFLVDLNKEETQQELTYYKKLTYGLGALCVLLIAGLVFSILRIKQISSKKYTVTDFSLTSQEETVAELMLENKTNKEIAAELFVSLNTVKTHIRNLYAKLEVSNRGEFVEKYKNHPRD
ncbi:helix-turn-helix transcriptional regulator [Algoriphagus sp. SE2]|uniref:response regulator transcription factor n=1 Tax=Algoriphagus sp. SE2 TaxID=3141536 RepID=UPI0031CD5033